MNNLNMNLEKPSSSSSTTTTTTTTTSTSTTTTTDLVIHSHSAQHVDRLTLPYRLFTVREKTVKIHQANTSDGKGGTDIGFGAAVYPSSIIMSHYLEHHARIYHKTVLELGGGHGFSGIAAALCGATSVITTDGDDISLELTQTNINENKVNANCKAIKLYWGDANDEANVLNCLNGNLPDIIIGSDITACPYADALPKLLSTLLNLSNENTSIILSHKSRNIDEEAFWSELATHFTIKSRDRVKHPDFADDDTLHLSVLKKIK